MKTKQTYFGSTFPLYFIGISANPKDDLQESDAL